MGATPHPPCTSCSPPSLRQGPGGEGESEGGQEGGLAQAQAVLIAPCPQAPLPAPWGTGFQQHHDQSLSGALAELCVVLLGPAQEEEEEEEDELDARPCIFCAGPAAACGAQGSASHTAPHLPPGTINPGLAATPGHGSSLQERCGIPGDPSRDAVSGSQVHPRRGSISHPASRQPWSRQGSGKGPFFPFPSLPFPFPRSRRGWLLALCPLHAGTFSLPASVPNQSLISARGKVFFFLSC